MTPLDHKVGQLQAMLAGLDKAVVCFSGGVDSAYLLAEAVGVLGARATALTAVSPSLAPEEGADARRLASEIGARHVLVETFELDDPRYAANPANRCYFCKHEVYGRAVAEARKLGAAHVLDGFNRDDRADWRPGRQAARELGRALAARRDRVHEGGHPDGGATPGPAGVGQAGARLPVEPLPVRHRSDAGAADPGGGLRAGAARPRLPRLPGALLRPQARIEVAPEEVARLREPALLADVTARFRTAGFDDVEIDPDGYRPGALNTDGPLPRGAP